MPGYQTTPRQALNSGSADSAVSGALLGQAQFGDMVFGISNYSLTQSASLFINLASFRLPDGRELPGIRAGSILRTFGAGSPNVHIVGESPCPDAPLVPGVATTFTGAANGTFTLTPRAVQNPAPLRVALINAEQGSLDAQSLQILAMVNHGFAEFWISAATDGAITSRAAEVVAAWNAHPVASLYAVAALATGNDGTGLVQQRIKDSLSIPSIGHVTGGPPLRRSPGYAISSYDGTMLWLGDSVTGAVLCYMPIPALYPDGLYPPAAVK